MIGDSLGFYLDTAGCGWSSMGRHYKQTRRARLLRLIREKIQRAGPDVDLNRLTLWHCGRSHPLAAMLVDVEWLGMRKLVSIVMELDSAQSHADQRKQTWVTRIVEASAAARLSAKDVAALLDRKGIPMRDSYLDLIQDEAPFSYFFNMSTSRGLYKVVADDAGPDHWEFLWYIHPLEFPIAYDLICRFAISRNTAGIESISVGSHTSP